MAPATDEAQEAASRDELSHAATLVDPTTLEMRSGELVRKWKTVAFDLASATIRAGTIIDPAREQALMTAHMSEHSGSAVTSPRPRDAEEFELGPVLGEGAMGIVHLAEQRTLHRKVAIKVAKADAGEAGYLAMLREARVTGALEHPNIIPVHALS